MPQSSWPISESQIQTETLPGIQSPVFVSLVRGPKWSSTILVNGPALVFVAIDGVRPRHVMKPPTPKPAKAAAPRRQLAGEFVEGFFGPANVRFHPGACVARKERKHLLRVGPRFGREALRETFAPTLSSSSARNRREVLLFQNHAVVNLMPGGDEAQRAHGYFLLAGHAASRPCLFVE